MSTEDWRRNDTMNSWSNSGYVENYVYLSALRSTCLVMTHELDVGLKTFLSISHLPKAVFYIHHYFHYNNRVAPSQFKSMFSLLLTFGTFIYSNNISGNSPAALMRNKFHKQTL